MVFTTIHISIVLISIMFLIRNTLVYNHSMKMLEKVSDKAKEDIYSQKEWLWRYEEFKSVSHYKMVYQFWKPLDSFYEDKDFLK